jgi:hypothetical protein
VGGSELALAKFVVENLTTTELFKQQDTILHSQSYGKKIYWEI